MVMDHVKTKAGCRPVMTQLDFFSGPQSRYCFASCPSVLNFVYVDFQNVLDIPSSGKPRQNSGNVNDWHIKNSIEHYGTPIITFVIARITSNKSTCQNKI